MKRTLELTPELLRAYSRRGNFHSDPEAASRLGYDKLIAQGAVPQSTTPAGLQKLIDSDRARYGKIIKEKGLKAE